MSGGQADPQLQRFIEQETQRQLFQGIVSDLTDQCWEKCVDKISARLDSRLETCLVNCVDRFLDTSNLVVRRLEQSAGSGAFGGESELSND